MSELIETVIKIKYVREGYLPDYPYHLISTNELLDAFFTTYTSPSGNLRSQINQEDFFHSTYYLPSGFESLQSEYNALHLTIQRIIFNWKKLQTMSVSTYDVRIGDITYMLHQDALPDWIYTFMLGQVICDSSDVRDRHGLLHMLDCDNMLDSFTVEAATKCYQISSQWISRLPAGARRPATIFGEPHVIKSLRLQQQGAL